MSANSLKNKIIEWLRPQSYWLQYAGNEILEGVELDVNLIDLTYRYFKEDEGLSYLKDDRCVVNFKEVVLNEEGSLANITLNAIHNIQYVNALTDGQRIEIDKNLTVIYGNNGSGKSGYVRLLNNAFNSRGDKSLIGNVYSSTFSGVPSCKFTFQINDDIFEKSYPEDHSSFEFSQYTSFDTHSVKVHLDSDNQLNFTPAGFEFFEKIVNLFDSMKIMLSEEIRSNQHENSFKVHFVNDNHLKVLIDNLSENTDLSELKALALITEEDKIHLKKIQRELDDLISLNVQDEIFQLEKDKADLLRFMEIQQNVLDYLTTVKLLGYSESIIRCNYLQTLSKEEGIKSLKEYEIPSINSDQWREFIIAAKNYVIEIETKNIKVLSDLSENDKCIFCLQSLSNKENNLIDAYWQFLKSDIENELSQSVQEINKIIKSLYSLNTVRFDETIAVHQNLVKTNPRLITRWKRISRQSELSIKNLLFNLENFCNDRSIEAIDFNTKELDVVIDSINESIDMLFAKKIDQEIKTLSSELGYLIDRSLLNKLMPSIEEYVERSKWAYAGQNKLSAFKTNLLTKFQGNLFNEFINKEYSEIFKRECIYLNAPNVVEIKQQNDKVRSFRKLLIAKRIVSQVLSKGEQRAISLADFLTEVQMNNNIRGVIFDDPVTSLDHTRRGIIAKRMVDLSETRQVIIFTHDVAFFSKLISLAAANIDITITKTSIRKFGDSVGLINPALPWIAQNISHRIKYLRNELVRITKLEKEGEEDFYNQQIKGWYGLLRESWERCVEERLFKGAIERFSGEIHTKPLSKIEINDDLINMINVGMTESSNWVHDQAKGLNPPIPDAKKAQVDFDLLISFDEKCKSN